jgi:hypothetical protein
MPNQASLDKHGIDFIAAQRLWGNLHPLEIRLICFEKDAVREIDGNWRMPVDTH